MFYATQTPPLGMLLDDLRTRDHKKIASFLGVSVKTLQRYIEAGQAPRAVELALFYETKWGQSLVHTTAHNGEMFQRQKAQGLERENASLRARIARLEALAAAAPGDGFGSSNEPFYAER